MTDVNSAGKRQGTLVTPVEVARQIRAVTDLLYKELELVYNLMKGPRQGPLRRNEETNGLTQGSSGAPSTISDTNNLKLDLIQIVFLENIERVRSNLIGSNSLVFSFFEL